MIVYDFWSGVVMAIAFLAAAVGVVMAFRHDFERGLGLALTGIAIFVVLVIAQYQKGTVLSIDGSTAVLAGPNEHRIVVSIGKFDRLRRGDEVEIAKKGNKWVVVQMTSR